MMESLSISNSKRDYIEYLLVCSNRYNQQQPIPDNNNNDNNNEQQQITDNNNNDNNKEEEDKIMNEVETGKKK